MQCLMLDSTGERVGGGGMEDIRGDGRVVGPVVGWWEKLSKGKGLRRNTEEPMERGGFVGVSVCLHRQGVTFGASTLYELCVEEVW